MRFLICSIFCLMITFQLSSADFSDLNKLNTIFQYESFDEEPAFLYQIDVDNWHEMSTDFNFKYKVESYSSENIGEVTLINQDIAEIVRLNVTGMYVGPDIENLNLFREGAWVPQPSDLLKDL